MTQDASAGPRRFDDPRLLAAVMEYQEALDAGRWPGIRAFLTRYPELAGELTACLEGLSFLHGACRHVQRPGPPGGP